MPDWCGGVDAELSPVRASSVSRSFSVIRLVSCRGADISRRRSLTHKSGHAAISQNKGGRLSPFGLRVWLPENLKYRYSSHPFGVIWEISVGPTVASVAGRDSLSYQQRG